MAEVADRCPKCGGKVVKAVPVKRVPPKGYGPQLVSGARLEYERENGHQWSG
jgi:rRNA maturation protein Nop10